MGRQIRAKQLIEVVDRDAGIEGISAVSNTLVQLHGAVVLIEDLSDYLLQQVSIVTSPEVPPY